MKKAHLLLMFAVISPLFFGCGSDNNESQCVEQPDISASEVNIEIVQKQHILPNIRSKDSLVNFLNDNPVIGEIFLKRSQFPDDSILVQESLRRFSNVYMDTLQMEVDRVFGNVKDLEAEFSNAYRHIDYYYPGFRIPEVETIVSGINHDLFVSDSLIIIGLDYYLGEGAKFRPAGIYQYMLTRYTPDKVVPSVMLLYGISPSFNKTDLANKTMLADMISFGKAYYFAKHMMPCVPDSTFISYSSKNMVGVRKNKGTVWAHFLEKELLFETSHVIKKKYLEERPNTVEIGDEAPGRIATWVGWQIVNAYMDENPEITLQELMAEPNAQKILDGSNYAPKNE